MHHIYLSLRWMVYFFVYDIGYSAMLMLIWLNDPLLLQ